MNVIQIIKLNGNAILPFYATDYSSGMDLCASNTDLIIIEPGEFKMIPTGIAIAIPHGYEAQIRPRSGLAAKYGITVLNSPGTIDSDYRGEIKVLLINHGKTSFVVEKNMRIAQMVVAKYTNVVWSETDQLNKTIRDCGGFGSSGI